MSKQTSIEWLEMELKKLPSIDVLKTFEKAKQMHKEEITDAYGDGLNAYRVEFCNRDEYYQKTYEQSVTNSNYLSSPKEISEEKPMRYHCVPKEISDDEIFKQSIKTMEEMYGSGSLTEIDAYFRGAKWMQKQLKGDNK